MRDSDVLQVDCLRRRKGRPSVDISIWVGNEVFELFLSLEAVDLAIEEGQVVVIFNADLDVLPSYLIADGAEIEVFGDVVQDAVGAKPNVGDI